MERGSRSEVYSVGEVARAARVPRALANSLAPAREFLTHREALDVIRAVQAGRAGRAAPIGAKHNARRSAVSLVLSGALHAAFLALLVMMASLHWFEGHYTDVRVERPETVHLVFTMEPGPGGGGGGGGASDPAPVPKAERQAPAPKKISSPVPPVQRTPPPPKPHVPAPAKPVELPKPDPRPEPPPVPAAPQAVVAPVVPAPADAVDAVGLARSSATNASNGLGTGGGVGTGAGTGLGPGDGGGIGPGSGGGTGGGPYQPGNGIVPPTLEREVHPLYTDEARRRVIEGDVVLEIVVRRDGSVGNVRVLHTLGAGLEQKAIDAVRQWRFGPAKRQGVAVDVVVEVSVGFSLR